jgi:hypothetical protein
MKASNKSCQNSKIIYLQLDAPDLVEEKALETRVAKTQTNILFYC